MRSLFLALVCVVALLASTPALAHVTVQPSEALVGDFARFVVRVPNERDNADTVRVQVRFPALAFVSFEPKEGWTRNVRMTTLDEPIVVFGNEITEVVGRVTWSGGRIRPNEFVEFGFSARTPDEQSTLRFEAIQTYSSGEVVRWTGEPESETPAATVTTYDIDAPEDAGQLGVLARTEDTLDRLRQEVEGGRSWLSLAVAGVALVVAVAALVLASRRRAG